MLHGYLGEPVGNLRLLHDKQSHFHTASSQVHSLPQLPHLDSTRKACPTCHIKVCTEGSSSSFCCFLVCCLAEASSNLISARDGAPVSQSRPPFLAVLGQLQHHCSAWLRIPDCHVHALLCGVVESLRSLLFPRLLHRSAAHSLTRSSFSHSQL